MKKIRIILTKYHITSIIGLMFLLFSCTKDDMINNQQSKDHFTDEEVFKGVMFLEGPVADKLDNFKDLNFRSFVSDNSQIEEIVKFQNEIITELKSTDPLFFSKFRKNIGSGDYHLVQSTLSKTSNKIATIAYQLANLNNDDVSIAAKKFTSTLQHKYHIDENSSKEDLIKAIKSIKSDKQTSKVSDNVYYYKWAAVWLAAAAALVIVIFLEEAPVDPINPLNPLEPFPDDPNDPLNSGKSFLIEDYQSEITFQLQ